MISSHLKIYYVVINNSLKNVNLLSLKVKLQILSQWVGEDTVHREPKSYKFNLLGKMVGCHVLEPHCCMFISSIY